MSRTNNGQPRPVGNSTQDALHLKLHSLSRLHIDGNTQRHRRNTSDHSPLTAGTDTSETSKSSRTSLDSYATQATNLTLTPTPYCSRPNTTTEILQEPTMTIPDYVPRKPPIRVILGTASVGSKKSPLAKITTVETLSKFTATFRARGYNDIDTARAYPVGRGGTCEQLLGEKELKLHTWANVSTKVSSFMPGSHRTKNVNQSIEKSLEALQAEDGVDIMYLHAPDRATPFSETCEAMHEAWLEGKFQRFGLSNYSVEQVEEIVKICQECGYNPPTVYQGQYNPICRGAEERLFDILRQHNIAFYAYSPSACGFFSNKVTRASATDTDSRWNIASPLGAKYAGDYFHDPLFAAAETVRMQAKKYGISGHAAALRWTTWHSRLAAEAGDAVIIGASKIEQLEENLDILEQGPLPDDLVEVIDKIWMDVQLCEKGPRFSFV